MKRSSSYKIADEVMRRGGNCKGKPMPDGPVANGGKRNTGNVGNEIGNGQRDSRLDKMLRSILNIE